MTSDRGCFIAVPMWQQRASEGLQHLKSTIKCRNTNQKSQLREEWSSWSCTVRTTWECFDHASQSFTFPRMRGSTSMAASGRTGPQSTVSTPSMQTQQSTHLPQSALDDSFHDLTTNSQFNTITTNDKLHHQLTLWRLLFPYGYSYKASCARLG